MVLKCTNALSGNSLGVVDVMESSLWSCIKAKAEAQRAKDTAVDPV